MTEGPGTNDLYFAGPATPSGSAWTLMAYDRDPIDFGSGAAVLAWNLDEPRGAETAVNIGTAVDGNLTIHGTPRTQTLALGGFGRSAIWLPGTNPPYNLLPPQRIEGSALVDLGTPTALTLSAVFCQTSRPNEYACLVTKQENPTWASPYVHAGLIVRNGRPQFQVSSGGFASTLECPFDVGLDTLRFVHGIFDGSLPPTERLSLWVDGAKVAEGAGPESIGWNTNEPIRIGHNSEFYAQPFGGMISTARVHALALSPVAMIESYQRLTGQYRGL
ncbi:MAG: hypothetical protein JNK72_24565 [Myxococcales bacterium]|nr:hypothetical protein [Myxococcales bacterium]